MQERCMTWRFLYWKRCVLEESAQKLYVGLAMDRITKKNRDDWNRFSAEDMKNTQSEERLHEILVDPACAFVPEAWSAISQRYPSLSGRKICVPSCGDCHAVYAFALLGASVVQLASLSTYFSASFRSMTLSSIVYRTQSQTSESLASRTVNFPQSIH